MLVKWSAMPPFLAGLQRVIGPCTLEAAGCSPALVSVLSRPWHATDLI